MGECGIPPVCPDPISRSTTNCSKAGMTGPLRTVLLLASNHGVSIRTYVYVGINTNQE